MTILKTAFQASSRMMEWGLLGADTALRTMQDTVGLLAGENGRPSLGASLHGPNDLDRATAEFANRMLRTFRRRGLRPSTWGEVSVNLLDAARASLPSGEGKDLRHWLALSAQLPMSMGTLAVQEMLRGLVTAQSVPPRLLPDFVAFVVEIFSDLHIYFSLQYGEELARYKRLVGRNPGDATARLELGRMYTKCGLFDQAVAELDAAAKSPATKQRALYESMVAHHRAGRYRRAIDSGVSCLSLAPTDDLARYWLWLTAQKLGGYPEDVPDDRRMEVKAGYHPTELEFEEVSQQIGLDKTSGGRGTAVLDFDGDGHLDVVIAGAHAGVSLYRNNGDGTFEDVSTGSGLDKCVYAFGVAAGDYDNDGRPDLFVTSLGFFNGEARLYHNEGDGTFRDVTRDAGVRSWGPAFVATWVDYDGDGLLDLFVVNNLGGLFDRKTPNQLFRNNGDGTFRDVTEEAGLRTTWPSLGAAWGDFNNNGHPDLFVSNMGRSQLFRNNGDGTFTEESQAAGVDAPCIGSNALCCDIDDDGWLDIIQFTYSRPQDAIHTLRTGEGPPDGSPMRVFRNNRDGTFSLISRELGLTGCWGTMSGNAGDFNNDGHLDLLLGNGDPSMDRNEAAILLESDGSKFHNVTFSAGLPVTGKGHGVNMADLTGDGRLHLIVGSGGLYPGDLSTTSVFRPKRTPANYLNIRLVGTKSNRDAIGARLVLEAGSHKQHRLVSGGTGFGCLPYEQHFGLGRAESVRSLEILWPSGLRQCLEGLPVNEALCVTEGHDGWEIERLMRRG